MHGPSSGGTVTRLRPAVATYHDVLALSGIPGVGMVRRPGGDAGWGSVHVVVDATYGCHVAFGGPARPDMSAEDNVRALVATGPGAHARPGDEWARLSTLLPVRGCGHGPRAHEDARAAVWGARLPYSMRTALDIVLDHGVPMDLATVQSMRRASGDAMWEALALACTRGRAAGLLCREDVRAFLLARAAARRAPPT